MTAHARACIALILIAYIVLALVLGADHGREVTAIDPAPRMTPGTKYLDGFRPTVTLYGGPFRSVRP